MKKDNLTLLRRDMLQDARIWHKHDLTNKTIEELSCWVSPTYRKEYDDRYKELTGKNFPASPLSDPYLIRQKYSRISDLV